MRPVAVRTSRHGGAEQERQQVIPFSLFRGGDAKFQHQRKIAESARGTVGRLHVVRRYAEQHLGARTGDEFQAFVSAELIKAVASSGGLAPNIVAELLFQ